METRPFGWSGVRVPVIGQGTWNLEQEEPALALAALQRGIDAGMTHIDTAEIYGAGAVEELLGKVLSGRRDELFLASKVAPDNATLKGTIAACEGSLRRLRTDRLDLYLLHWPSQHPLDQTIAAFERLVEDGKIRLWGVSNFDARLLELAVEIAGEGRVACNQVLYHLGERYVEQAIVPACERHRIPIVAYSPFGAGQFPSRASHGGRVLEEIGAAHGATARQVALRFLVRRPSVFTIPKAGRVEHVLENAGAAELSLTGAELARIASAFPGREAGLEEELPVI